MINRREEERIQKELGGIMRHPWSSVGIHNGQGERGGLACRVVGWVVDSRESKRMANIPKAVLRSKKGFVIFRTRLREYGPGTKAIPDDPVLDTLDRPCLILLILL